MNYDNVQYRGVDEGFRTANDADKARWAEIIAAQNAGDSARVTDLLNAMSAEGNFSGYYGDDGLYYGYARGCRRSARRWTRRSSPTSSRP